MIRSKFCCIHSNSILNNLSRERKILSKRSISLIGWSDSIARSSIVGSTMNHLISFHQWSNLPWYGEITIITLMARGLIAFPLTVLQRRILLRYEKLKPEIEALSMSLRNRIAEEAYLAGISQKKSQQIFLKEMTKGINRLIVRDNCHPLKASLVTFFQIPFWIILSNCFRNFARIYPDPNDPQLLQTYEQLQTEGIFWFSNLTVPDPIGLLPFATILINLSIIQMHVAERRRLNIKDSKFIKIITNFSRILSFGLLIVGLTLPADMSYYWFVSSSFGLLQNIILRNPKMKSILKIK
ncbi:Cytochrome c oxidase assembly protein COX18 [Sarcoptes scabiei]|uniref:Mitochondrial inner membrane protein COX18 n=1 Tax=Sarcoptes scabiei TaxID=52283 RepID=A0A834VEN4_SARSC|nr:Cytochrome c oxidase assembly protein COX18 [Sarcoptes scabiei]